MTKGLEQEIELNFDKFTLSWKDRLSRVTDELDKKHQVYLESYRRLTSLNAWRQFLLEDLISEGGLSFFLEAQNDGLTSHVLARLGSWRSALKALRSCIENVFFCLYYKDHVVELQLWEEGKHKLSFTDLCKYLTKHPQFSTVDVPITGMEILCREYETLSKAVHASSVSFRMTVDARSTLLWSHAQKNLGAWACRESLTLQGLNLLLLTIFRSQLQGAKLPYLRQAISLAIPPSKHNKVKEHLNVTLT